MADAIVLKFTPANPGDHLTGVPARDLTEADLANIEPFDLRNMTVPGPSGKAMYTYADEALAKGQVPPSDPPAETPPAETPPSDPPADQKPDAPAARRGRANDEEKGA